MDNKAKRGKQDRAKINGKEPYEVRYVADKFGVSPQLVRNAIKAVGNGRKRVYAYIQAALKVRARKAST